LIWFNHHSSPCLLCAVSQIIFGTRLAVAISLEVRCFYHTYKTSFNMILVIINSSCAFSSSIVCKTVFWL
jgi:hypothetical protein